MCCQLPNGKKTEFEKGIKLFNNQEWYEAHDVFEDIWHNINGAERITVQAILQIAVAQVHLSNDNKVGATILYGEGLGRLKQNNLPSLGLDLDALRKIVEKRLKVLQHGGCILELSVPQLLKIEA